MNQNLSSLLASTDLADLLRRAVAELLDRLAPVERVPAIDRINLALEILIQVDGGEGKVSVLDPGGIHDHHHGGAVASQRLVPLGAWVENPEVVA